MGAKDPAAPAVEPVELPSPVATGVQEGHGLMPNAVELVQDTAVVLEVRLGETSLSIRQLLDLRDGSVIELDRAVDEPVDVLFNGKVIARGQLVAHGDQFGVQITEIRSQG